MITVKCKYSGGKIIPLEGDQIAAYKATLKDGTELSMTIEKRQEKRTRAQQGLLHKLLGRYARAMGEALGDVKMRCKVDLGYWMMASKIIRGDVPLPSWRGAWIDLHDVYPAMYIEQTIAFVRSESDYTKRMEIDFVDYIIKLCTENGVEIGDIMRSLE